MADILENILPGVDSEPTVEDEPLEETGEETEGEPEGEPDGGEAADAGDADGDADAAADSADDRRARGDGRTLPSALKDLIKAHPEHSKLLKDLYFTNAAYGKFGKTAEIKKIKDAIDSFGTFEEFTAVKDRIEALGGPGAIEELAQTNQQYRELEAKFDAADPGYIEQIAKGNPESFAKLAPTFISRFGSDHPEAYNHLMAQVVTNTLIQNGTFNNIAMLEAAITAGNTQQAAEALKQVKSALNSVQTLAQQAPKITPSADPKRSEYETKLQQIESERKERFVSDIRADTNGWITPEISNTLASYLKGKTVTGAFKQSLDGAIKEEIGKILNNNASFKSKRDAAFKRGDRGAILSLYKQFATPLIPTAARKVAKEFGLSVPAKKAGATTQQPATNQNGKGKEVEAGWEKVTKYPDPKDVRKDIPNYYDLAVEDKFYLKNGKKIQVVS